MEYGHVKVVPALRKQQVATQRAIHGDALRTQCCRGRHGNACVVVAKQAGLGSMGVDAHEAHTWRNQPSQRACTHARQRGVLHERGREARECGSHAFMQRDVHDAQPPAHEHEEDFVFGHAAHLRDERRIATETQAGLMDRRLVMRTGDHGVHLAAPAGLQGSRGRVHGRTARVSVHQPPARRLGQGAGLVVVQPGQQVRQATAPGHVEQYRARPVDRDAIALRVT